ncbi:hypothetical protein BaRGS_00028943 [Batillaria attramentaria]|uniref:Uncharacterized protein n=1 Tax=Batillaria attramentaria TaxID=370345 RepID=A0ABD0JXY7_9CAEN
MTVSSPTSITLLAAVAGYSSMRCTWRYILCKQLQHLYDRWKINQVNKCTFRALQATFKTASNRIGPNPDLSTVKSSFYLQKLPLSDWSVNCN